MLDNIFRTVTERLWQHVISILIGVLIAFESSIPYFVPCMIVVLLDVYTANRLNKRIALKYPGTTDGKFKSIYGTRIFETMFMGLVLIILAHYVDKQIIQNGNLVVRYTVGIFIGYQSVSVLENWSSENDNKLALILQRVLVNKAERHLNIDLSDFWDIKKKKNKQHGNEDI